MIVSKIGRDVALYRAEIAKIGDRHKRLADWGRLALEFFPWRESLDPGRTPAGDERPWLTFAATRRLEALLPTGARVFEYGAGGSTLFFLKKGASVVTVEHNQQWIESVTQLVRQRGYDSWTPLLKPPVASPGLDRAAPEDPDAYVSSGNEFRGLSFESYASAIDAFAHESFDMVLLDGRARPSCGKHARPKVKKGGHIVLDNSERDTYEFVHADLARRGWKSEHFYGPGPYNIGFWQTSIYQRPMEGAG